jgi:hypothetical protein
MAGFPVRKPTEKEQAAIDKARRDMQGADKAKTDLLSRLMPTARMDAIRGFQEARERMNRIPREAREYESYNQAPYKKGGMVSSASKRADGCAQRGKTKGRFV